MNARTLLERFKNTECWCEVGVGNPMLKGEHSDLCKEIVAFIETPDDPPVQLVDGVIRPVPWPGEPPLLQCINCRNTESPVGAMVRYFNQGRCLHCGGWFKAIRA